MHSILIIKVFKVQYLYFKKNDVFLMQILSYIGFAL